VDFLVITMPFDYPAELSMICRVADLFVYSLSQIINDHVFNVLSCLITQFSRPDKQTMTVMPTGGI